jgi:hypothetical protein
VDRDGIREGCIGTKSRSLCRGSVLVVHRLLRDRLCQKEDRFFATVFFGSALLFLAMLFAAAALAGALILVASSAQPSELINSTTFRFVRAAAYVITNVYAIKMAGVFMISTSTVVIHTGIAPRWIAFLGYVLACILLVGSYYISWSLAVLPLWVFLLSIYILIDNLGRHPKAD